MKRAIIDMTPLGRIGKTEDIAEVVNASAGPFRWITRPGHPYQWRHRDLSDTAPKRVATTVTLFIFS